MDVYKVEFFGTGPINHVAFLLEVGNNRFNLYHVTGSPPHGFEFECRMGYDYENSITYIEGSKELIMTIPYGIDEFVRRLRTCVVDNITNELRKLQTFGSGDTSTCGLNKTAIRDALFGELSFNNEQELNSHMASTIRYDPKVKALVHNLLPTNSRFCLCHGDLHASNIIIKEDMSVVFVDWERMGFFPEYWDPTKMFVVSPRDDEIALRVTDNMNVDKNTLAAHLIMLVSMF
ncbi:hypothetical protein LPJ61_001882 [Coemansia biformis]|uniref:Aminoglycoside phosphotransferase domain-containing protein n=1 Tax=Coemansia biformis TaxID=1286918 RepID=A0A9W7YFV8_9FUNG|nr:hypothetical protein LPJ61_001882 [Coemansia biformis]